MGPKELASVSPEIKAQYFREYIEKGIRDIFEAQRLIATQRIYQAGSSRRIERRGGPTVRGRSGILKYSLTNPEYSITPDGEGLRTASTVPIYIRFLDMKQHGNYQIYNRQVWGILYSDVRKNMKYEFKFWLDKHFPELLEQFNNQSK